MMAKQPTQISGTETEHQDAAPDIDFDPAEVGVMDDPTRPTFHEAPNEEPAPVEQVTPKKGEPMSKEDFAGLFVGAFDIPVMAFGEDYLPLKVAPDEMPGAHATGHVLHGWVAKYAPWAMPSRDMISQEMGLAIMFVYGKLKAVQQIRADQHERRAQIERDKEETAPDDLNTPKFGGDLHAAGS